MSTKTVYPKVNSTIEASRSNGRLQCKKVVYNKALRSFIKESFGSEVHFGNMNNNLEGVLKKLSLDTIMEASVKLPNYSNTLKPVSEKENEFSDFDLYDSFMCTFLAKDNVSYEEFMEGLQTLKEKFLDPYNAKVHEEVLDKDYQNNISIRNREIKEITFFVLLAIAALVVIYFYL